MQKRPNMIWVFVGFYSLDVAVSVAQMALRHVALRHVAVFDPATITVIEQLRKSFADTIYYADLIAMACAAFLLFNLRARAIWVCAAICMMNLALLVLEIVDNDMAKMGFALWVTSLAIVLAIISNVLPSVAIFLYARRLQKKVS